MAPERQGFANRRVRARAQRAINTAGRDIEVDTSLASTALEHPVKCRGAGASFQHSEPFQSRLGGDDAPGDLPDQLLANRGGEIAETLDGHDKGAATSLARL